LTVVAICTVSADLELPQWSPETKNSPTRHTCNTWH